MRARRRASHRGLRAAARCPGNADRRRRRARAPRHLRRWPSAFPSARWSCRSALLAELAALPAGVGIHRGRPGADARAVRTGRLLPADRRRAGPGQCRLDAAHRGSGRCAPGADVEALRVRVVAQGAARGAGRAFPRSTSTRTSTSPNGRPRYRAGGGEVVAATAAGGDGLYAARLAGRVAVAIGNEGAGLAPSALLAQATQRVTIPMPGGMESLNAAAATAVCLFECVRQRAAARRPDALVQQRGEPARPAGIRRRCWRRPSAPRCRARSP